MSDQSRSIGGPMAEKIVSGTEVYPAQAEGISGPAFFVQDFPDMDEAEILNKTSQTQTTVRILFSIFATLLPSFLLWGGLFAIRNLGLLTVFFVDNFGLLLRQQDILFTFVGLMGFAGFGILASIARDNLHVIPSFARIATLTLGSKEMIRGPGMFFTAPFNLEARHEVLDMMSYTIGVGANYIQTRDNIPINLGVNAWIRRSEKNTELSTFRAGKFWRNMLRVVQVSTLFFAKLHGYEELKGKDLGEDEKPVSSEEVREEMKVFFEEFLKITQERASPYGGTIDRIEFADVQLADLTMARALASPKILEKIAEGKARGARKLGKILKATVKALVDDVGLSDEEASVLAPKLFMADLFSQGSSPILFSGDMFGLGEDVTSKNPTGSGENE